MKRLADFWQLADGFDKAVVHKTDVRRGEADAGQTGHVIERLQQVGERRLVRRRALLVAASNFRQAIGRDILPQKEDFLGSGLNQAGCFSDDVRDGSAVFTAASIGHNAVGAELIAAAHDRDHRADVPGLVAIGLRRRWSGVAGQVDQALSCLGLFNQVRNGGQAVGAGDKVNVRQFLQQAFAAVLRHAADDADHQFRLDGFPALQQPGLANGFAFRLIPDAACVEDDYISVFFRRRRGQAALFE